MKKTIGNETAGKAREGRGMGGEVGGYGKRGERCGMGAGTCGNGDCAGGGKRGAGSVKRKAGRPLTGKARRFVWAESRRKDLAKPIEHLRYVEQLLDQYVDAKSQEDIDWVRHEMGNALVDAIGAIVRVHEFL